MFFHSVENPFQNTHIVKLESDQHNNIFRPSAIGSDFNTACEKAKMEELEEVFCDDATLISTAAHRELHDAVYNAQREAVERISLSAWWAFDRPVIGRLRQIDKDAIITDILPKDGSFSAEVGFVEPACETGYAAVSILESKIEYPRIVLGSSYDSNPILAAEKALWESVQSWAATSWLKDNDINNIPYWDNEELFRRSCNIRNAIEIGNGGAFSESIFNAYFNDKPLKVVNCRNGYAVGVDVGVAVNGLTHLIAELDRHIDESTKVFTQHNF